ncbi:hypothetical protein C0991_009828 [Blastosporella zonata]|nr:hypothetical protein C0991_009828 [Blastosporella zonata]
MSLATLKTLFAGDIVTPADSDYPIAIARWALNAARRAKVVAFVKNEADVKLAIKYACDEKLPIAIRGGGHSPAGASSSEGGLVIDLSRYLTTVRVDAEKRLAYVGGGALWASVDRAAIIHGLATVAGTVSHTGVGGLTLGGGYGWLSSEHGMVLDNLVQTTVVTADGSIVVANEENHSELFFGLRGGGSNFGVVTEFVYQLHPQRATVYGREHFKAFHDLAPALDDTKEIPYEELNDMLNPKFFHGQCVYFKGLAHSKPEYKVASKAFEKIISGSDSELNMTVGYEYFPLGKIGAQPKDKTAFRRDPTPSVVIAGIWKEDSPAATERAKHIVHELAAIITGGYSDLTRAQRCGYSNYDNEAVTGEKEAVPDKARVVFGENYPRLQAVKKRYDPDNIFNKWFPITPA